MKQWMTCTTCRRVVLANETGICQNCQGGFSHNLGADDYFMQQPVARNEIKDEIEETKERINAIEKRLQQESDKREHQDGDESREATKAGYSHFPPNCS